MDFNVNTYTCNAIGKDGKTYAIYFECSDLIDAENIIRQIGLTPDEAGVCLMVTRCPDRRSNND